MEDPEVQGVVAHVPVNVQEGVLPLVQVHAQQDVVAVPVLVREFVAEVVAEAVLTIVLVLAGDVVVDVLDAISNNLIDP